MDPRTGLSWLYEGLSESQLGQFQFRSGIRYPQQGGRFRIPARRPPAPAPAPTYYGSPVLHDQFAVQLYELREGFSSAINPPKWERLVNYTFARADVARHHYDRLCEEMNRIPPQNRMIVKLFGRQILQETVNRRFLVVDESTPRTSSKWDVIAECNNERLWRARRG